MISNVTQQEAEMQNTGSPPAVIGFPGTCGNVWRRFACHTSDREHYWHLMGSRARDAVTPILTNWGIHFLSLL